LGYAEMAEMAANSIRANAARLTHDGGNLLKRMSAYKILSISEANARRQEAGKPPLKLV
jgi:hypothetical protein